LSVEAAAATGLKKGTPVAYRAGDQPNNALSLGVLQPGQVAATGGTSGVVYGVLDRPLSDPLSRVNGFAHVNHSPDHPRIGVLLCINGAGISYSWLRQQVAQVGITYDDMERQAQEVAPGSDGLRILPFGNGAERMLGNQSPGAQILGLQFNRHGRSHLYRAALEGIAFSFVYGVRILQKMGVQVTNMRVGNDNLFRSEVFSKTIATLLRCCIEVVETNGAVGAARAAGVATGFYPTAAEAVAANQVLLQFGPAETYSGCLEAYEDWELKLGRLI
jgi:xylulokinase